jgi:GGDEF domain-containing protein
MLSTSLSQLLERARTRFGVDVEILDAGLQHVYPESGGELGRLIDDLPAIRRSLLDSLAAGRPAHLEHSGLTFRLIPLRPSARLRHAGGLMAVRRTSHNGDIGVEPWSELARAIVEADFAAADTLSEERLHSRRLLAVLRFLRHVMEIDTEVDLAQAVVQAAAVWFDVDARIYQRDLAGDYSLHTALPGAQVEDAAKHLNSLWLSSTSDVTRLESITEWGHLPGTAEVVLVPLSAGGDPEGVLALIGTIPTHAEIVFPILGRLVGVQIQAMRAARRERTREVFEAVVNDPSLGSDLIPVKAIRELLDLTGAASAALTLNRGGRLRRLVSVGSVGDPVIDPAVGLPAGRDWLFGPDQFVCDFRLTATVSATLELRPRPGETFTPDAALVTREAARVLQTWLRGAEPSLVDGSSTTAIAVASPMSAFIRRIEEELERAKRFDLRLSLVLIDVPRQLPGEEEAFAQLQDTLRRELRGSDVLGKMNAQRVAALLTHTDAPGSFQVVGRMRRRLAETAARLNLPGVTIGHAVFSPHCRTAEALVSQAVRDAEPVATL